MMKTKRLLQRGISALFMLFVFTCGLCATTTDGDEHTDAVMKMIECFSGNQENELPKAQQNFIMRMLQTINKPVLTSENAFMGDALASEYIKDGGGRQFMYHVLAKQLEKEISTDEIDSVLALIDTEEYRLFDEHSEAVDTASVMVDVLTVFMDMIISQTVKTVKYRCPKDYVKKYHLFYDNSSLKRVIENVYQEMKNIQEKSDEDEIAVKIMETFQSNLPIICANASYGVVTEADLDFGIKLYNMPAYKKYSSVLLQNQDNQIDMMKQECPYLIQSYCQWLNKRNHKNLMTDYGLSKIQ